ncbi:pyridoxal phosphate-dependent aminotransferase [Nocardioides sp. R-C-SC26]|uniref:pyridoxal phosphate-dependent aminotransferase n=1 Tax=Nocardioides sp. R-C-SC26 TaxID=2870414 RepID=UPI001E32344F|nr:pyridoxal phosphate-dependent aminotransferase [Nocardioides sp. R-C-SC26]
MTASRLRDLPPTIFGQMSALAARTGAINLGQGFPDVDGPASVLAVAAEAVAGEQRANQYAPGIGIAPLREAIARHQERHYGLMLDPDTEVIATTGCTEAIAAALLGLVEPGDEVVVLEPYYDSYVAMLEVCGGIRRPVTLRAPDFRVDLDELRAAVGPRTRFVLLNTPHNPTGSVLNHQELSAIAELAVEHDLTVISDEVYEHLTFGRAHVPIATLPGMRERTLTLSSVGKSYSVTGWKIGWATGPAHLVEAALAAKQWLSYTSGSPLQPAVAYALDHEPAFPAELARDLAVRRTRLVDGLRALGLPTYDSDGTYFAMSDVGALGWRDGLEFCLDLPERAGVVAIPAQVFHDRRPDGVNPGAQLVRWAFCKSADVLDDALARLAAARLER